MATRDIDKDVTFGEWLSETFKSKDAREVLVKGYPWLIGWSLIFIFVMFDGGVAVAIGFVLVSLILTGIVTGVILGYKKLKKWSENGEKTNRRGEYDRY